MKKTINIFLCVFALTTMASTSPLENFSYIFGKGNANGYTYLFVVNGFNEARIVNFFLSNDSSTGDDKAVSEAYSVFGYSAISPKPHGEVVIPRNLTMSSCYEGGGFGLDWYPGPFKEYKVVEIGRRAFMGCSGTTKVYIPDSVRIVDKEADEGCSPSIKFISYSCVVEVDYDEGGSVNTTGGCYKKGDKVRITAKPDQGYRFVGWRLCVNFDESVVSTTKTTFDYTVGASDEDVYICAIFEKNGDTSDDDNNPVVPIEGLTPDFDESVKHTFNGLVYASDGAMCGMVQITTGKATKSGVSVGGSVMLANGKKQTLKFTGTVSGGYLTAKATVGKIGNLNLTAGGNGFKGTLGDMTLTTANTDEGTGILSGTLKFSYFDAKTGKVKTKSITVGGVASGGEAIGTATVKGQGEKSFAAEVEL